MDNLCYYFEYGSPFQGGKRNKTISFLEKNELSYDESIEYTVNIKNSKNEIVATGSLTGNVIKCIAVDKDYQGMDLSSALVTELLNYGMEKGYKHLFLYTKPKNKGMFEGLGFYEIVETKDVLFMENERNGIQNYVNGLERSYSAGNIGCIVANCNPFTYGHRYLIEYAAKSCDELHLFILSENKSLFPTETRIDLVKEGIRDVKNIKVHETCDYMISAAVFPNYFIKEKERTDEIQCELDLKIFCQHVAKNLGITKRFVGTEPYNIITRDYNQKMKQILSQYGVETIEIQRKKEGLEEISASRVRRLMKEKSFQEIKRLVPESTYQFIISEAGKRLIEE